MNLEEIAKLAGELPSLSDDRPKWLRDMPSASDSTALYYRFFHELVKRYAPLRVLEIGTYKASSAAHLAFANKEGYVLTIDISPESKVMADALDLPNLEAWTSDSMKAVERFEGAFDVCFIDGLHNFNQTYGEYVEYRKWVRGEGLLFFDDLGLEMATNEMEIFWSFVPDPKRRLDTLHYTGFGVVQKDNVRSVKPWSEIIEAATSKMNNAARLHAP